MAHQTLPAPVLDLAEEEAAARFQLLQRKLVPLWKSIARFNNDDPESGAGGARGGGAGGGPSPSGSAADRLTPCVGRDLTVEMTPMYGDSPP
jgi:hypothetical protein